MNILVTGSNGFVGTKLMFKLEEHKHNVIGIDISSHSDYPQKHPNTILGDIRIIDDLNKAWEKSLELFSQPIDLIIHCAASKHDFGISDKEYYSHNQFGTKIITQFMSVHNLKKIIYYSTVGVQGHSPEPKDELGELAPNHPYGASKLAGEEEIIEWMKNETNSEVIFLRPSVIYGEYHFANMYKMINMMHKRPWFMLSEGNYVKSIVSVNNIIDMTLFLLLHFKQGIQIFNGIDKPYYTLKELMEIICLNKNFKIPFIKIPYWLALSLGKMIDIPANLFKIDFPINSNRIKKFVTPTFFYGEKIRELGYVQQNSIETEMSKMTDWYMKCHQ